MPMLHVSAEDLVGLLNWTCLVGKLRDVFRSGDCVAPPRHHHMVPVPGSADATLLIMPAWQYGGCIGVKLVTVFPGNADRGLPAIAGSYLLIDGAQGNVVALLDGGELTARRTAAISALTAQHLAADDSRFMLMVGTGRLSLNLIETHHAVRPLDAVHVYGRSAEKAACVAAAARQQSINALPVTDLEGAARKADIISCATLSSTPLIFGEWLKSGVHVDLVGAFKANMRETDDAVMARAEGIFVDTRAGAFAEAGDILQAIQSGAIPADPIAADLFDLARGGHQGRESQEDITVFKSVGASLSDLAAALYAVQAYQENSADR